MGSVDAPYLLFALLQAQLSLCWLVQEMLSEAVDRAFRVTYADAELVEGSFAGAHGIDSAAVG